MLIQRLNCTFNEIKMAPSDAGTMEFSGYGAVFGNVDAYGDVIEPGAFSKFLSDVKSGAQQWPAMLLQHGGYGMTAEDMTPIGVWSDLAEDGTGLKVSGRLADTPRGNEIYKLMKMEPRPAINGLSIGYIAKEWEQRSKPEDPRRRLKRIDLIEISPVTFPANGKARVDDVKSAAGFSDREFERLMRDAGFSRNEALIIMNQGFRHLKTKLGAGENGERDELAAALKRTRDIFKSTP
jgi:HK97 family phage prohead protease